MTPLEAIEKLSGQPVLVLGDMIADIYLYGTIARISREAPVLVLEQSTEKIVAGGAANVINNGATLGGRILPPAWWEMIMLPRVCLVFAGKVCGCIRLY